jgi:uroporphyrinogen-III decarboxylase
VAFPGEIKVFKKCPDCKASLPIQVCLSGAGFYIGQWCNNCGPINRLSVDYYGTREEAQKALDTKTWKRRGTGYHGR